MATVILPALLAQRAGHRELEIDGATAGEVLRRMESRFPDLRGWVLDEQGSVRRHIHIFVDSERADLATSTPAACDLHVVQAISGGSGEGEPVEILVGSRKGLLIWRGVRGERPTLAARRFRGQTVEMAMQDPESGNYLASVTHGQFGPRLFRTDDPLGTWEQADGPAFPEDTGTALERIWNIVPGEAPGQLWAGVAPAALFESRDSGASWRLNRALWDVPSRPQWEGGLGGLCLHSICPWPGEPQRLAVAISSAGVWITDDAGASWRRGGKGLVPRYLPEDARQDALMLCVHGMRRARQTPRVLYQQFHGGVYRSDDCGDTWTDISAGLPADFGFPVEVDPRDPRRLFVIPLASDGDRVPPEGRLRVFESRDAGTSWADTGPGLPQEGCFSGVLRQAFCHDGHDPLGLYFGTTGGELYAWRDGGQWDQLAAHLPAIVSVRAHAA